MLQKVLLAILIITALPHFMSAQDNPHPASVAPKPAATSPEQADAWTTALQSHRKQLIDRNGPGTNALLREQLLKMLASDQGARRTATSSPDSVKEAMQKLAATDAELTGDLKQIVQQKGWPTIALVGIDASNAAMTVLTHTPDHAWQLQLLPQLEQMADAAQIDSTGLALVIDKELISEGKLQRYGSQFKAVNGGMAMYGVEEPDRLDQRRAKAQLPPIQTYEDMLEKLYHMKVTKTIVSAAPANL